MNLTQSFNNILSIHPEIVPLLEEKRSVIVDTLIQIDPADGYYANQVATLTAGMALGSGIAYLSEISAAYGGFSASVSLCASANPYLIAVPGVPFGAGCAMGARHEAQRDFYHYKKNAEQPDGVCSQGFNIQMGRSKL
jgi:hypothetical protein